MIRFPNAKINLGLAVTERRPDGYHNLQTVFYPVQVCDALEVVRRAEPGITLHESGLAVGTASADNLVCRAYRLLAEEVGGLPGVDAYLNKQIPFGAGLGGGSADATFMLLMLNDEFHLGLSPERIEALSARLGADCPFFCRNVPVYAEGTGNEFTDLNLSLRGHYLVLVKPPFGVSTKEAFGGIVPQRPEHSVREVVETMPVSAWRGLLMNDFERTVFPLYPELASIKERLYAQGALYASMSGSGSTMFGIFASKPELPEGVFDGCFVRVLECKE